MNREWIKEDDAQNEVGSCCHFAIKTCCLMLFVHLIPLSCTDPAFFWRFFLIESRDGTHVWPPKRKPGCFEHFWTTLYDFIYIFLCNIDRPFGPRFLTLTYSFVLCRASFRWWFCLRCKSYVRVLPWTYAYVIICMHVYKTSLLQAKCTTSI